MLFKQFVPLVGFAFTVPRVWAGYNAGATSNIAVYWGQNSYGQSGSQDRLSAYCANTDIDIIPLAFLNLISDPTTVNFASASDNCTAFPGTSLLRCPEIEEDIKTCQSQYGKTILLSIGGATYTQGGFPSASDAETWADTVWAMFGPEQGNSSAPRPFGSAVVDGFDFDFESTTSNMAPFGKRLRASMDAASTGAASGGKRFYLSAAPQCVYPDAADADMLDGAVAFDFVMVQFYNNWCGAANFVPGAAAQNAFNFDVWDNWAKNTSLNRDVKLLLGLPGAAGAGGGYVSGPQLAAVVEFSMQFSSFAGVMVWDMSQVYKNPGFLDAVVAALDGEGGGPVPTSTSTTTTTTASTTFTTRTTTSSEATPTASLVPQWGQCGGQGYEGSTECQPPYTCVTQSPWWAQCQ